MPPSIARIGTNGAEPHDGHNSPCELLGKVKDDVAWHDRRIDANAESLRETAKIMETVATRVGVMRSDGTATPHSLTSAVQGLGNQVLELKRAIESQSDSDPPLASALDDNPITEITRSDIQRPVFTSRRLRSVSKQRNWMAIGFAVMTFAAGAIEAARVLGWIK